ncbi:uncharacterized protein A1O5_04087 [Cladophialophora psammophila CBS 110553]|uniref:Uncharacterized protein n=1 Tax=Cladophialophora psammophila CBS 110553 TaxID=1182543 RepID=W9WYC7_9EURO|nr:uncharacterized protein A1O5_04087 [Cladophialophora psammophila CBS 110553]EXJ72938.1 hypothetical protein A1O5_04087 [Cladophialophora psammophila CBS 110553]
MLDFMMMRFGRRLFFDQGRADLARLCIDSAKALFEALDDKVYLLQSKLSDAQLKYLCGNFTAAPVAIDTIRQENRVFRYLQELSSRDAHNARVLGMPILNLLTGYDRIVSAIYGSSNDANAINTWRNEYRDLGKDLGLMEIITAKQCLSDTVG